jgi:HPt (histidine-containing phosphotransfer) domain-containing protein
MAGRGVSRRAGYEPMTIDFEELQRRVDRDRGLLEEIVAIARQDLPRLSAELRKAIAVRDFATVAAHAHTLKGMLSNLGAIHAATDAAKIEQLARQRSTAGQSALLDEFDALLRTVIRELELCLAEAR